MQPTRSRSDSGWYAAIGAISFIIVGLVALLIYKARFVTTYDRNIYILPEMNAWINGTVSLLLIAGYYCIRYKKARRWHRAFMIIAFVLSCMFLMSYVLYHASAPETRFGDLNHDGIVDTAEKAAAGGMRYFYFFLLSTHIILATAIVPLILITFYCIWRNNTAGHRRIARWTLPLWLYVSVTGVVVYLLISKYYPV
jgi:putative membrane protein